MAAMANHQISPANSSNSKWLANKRKHYRNKSSNHSTFTSNYSAHNFIASDYDHNDEDGDSIARMLTEEMQCGSSITSCDAWHVDSSRNKYPRTPPFCSSPPYQNMAFLNENRLEEPGGECIANTNCHIISELGRRTRSRKSKKYRVINAKEPKKLHSFPELESWSICTSNYYADEDDAKFPSVIEGNDSYVSDGSKYENSYFEASDMESVTGYHGNSIKNMKNNLSVVLGRWKEAKVLKIVEKLKKEEAAIDVWERKKTSQAKLKMKKLEMKMEKKRAKAMQKMQLKILKVQKEAKMKKTKERHAAERKIVEVKNGLANHGIFSFRFICS